MIQLFKNNKQKNQQQQKPQDNEKLFFLVENELLHFYSVIKCEVWKHTVNNENSCDMWRKRFT